MTTYKNHFIEIEKQILSKYASLSCNTKGRDYPISEDNLRTEYQRDRDRIIHSKAFRRLKHKTQVFLAPDGDHYRTRLTHTLEVSQIARTIAKALRLNEDLVEAIALGHDLGHTPFGHAGEKKLNELVDGGFEHAKQSLRVVELLEHDGQGLNLTYEVREGIVSHNQPFTNTPVTLEGEIIKYADRFAYINHDIEDAISADILSEDKLPKDICDILGHTKGERINTMITDIVNTSFDKPYINMSKPIFEATFALHDFMYKNIYTNSCAKADEPKAVAMLEQIFDYYMKNPNQMPQYYQTLLDTYKIDRVVADYVSSFTDQYCVRKFEELFIPSFWKK